MERVREWLSPRLKKKASASRSFATGALQNSASSISKVPSYTWTHRCLKIPEIVILIAEELYALERRTARERSRRQSMLIDLAVANRVFTEVALDTLWRDIVSLGFLVKVLPNRLWKEAESKKPDREGTFIFLLKEPSQADWVRFCYYNQKILSLRLTDEVRIRYTPAHDSAIQRLVETCPGGFLPSVSHIAISAQRPYHLRSAAFFDQNQTPVTHLEFSASSFTGSKEEFCKIIARHCSRLQVLEFEDDGSPDVELKLFSRLIVNLRHLRRITLNSAPLLDSIAAHLGTLPSLREMHIARRPTVTAVAGRRLTTIDGRFPELQRVHLWFKNWDAASITFESLYCPFKSLNLVVSETPDYFSEQMTDTMKSLFSHPTLSQTLTSFILHTSPTPVNDRPDNDAEDASIQETFSPLFTMKALETLELRGVFFGRFNDAWLSKAADSWPHLREITLGGAYTLPRATLAGFIPLVQKCRQLQRLHIAAMWEPFDLDLLPKGVCNKAILSLQETGGTLVDPEGTCRCLRQLFPRLRFIRQPYGGHVDQAQWRELQALLQC